VSECSITDVPPDICIVLSKFQATPKPFFRVIDSQGSAPGQCGWYADVFDPRTLAIFLCELAQAKFLRDSSQVPNRNWLVTNKDDPRTIEFRIFALRAEETHNQMSAWKGLSSMKSSSSSLTNWLGLSEGDGANGGKGAGKGAARGDLGSGGGIGGHFLL